MTDLTAARRGPIVAATYLALLGPGADRAGFEHPGDPRHPDAVHRH